MWSIMRILGLFLLLVGCDGVASTAGMPPNTVDETGLVEFYLPPGWVKLSSSQKSRFVPDGEDQESAMLGVIPTAEHRTANIDEFWQNTKAKHEFQDQTLVSERSANRDGFEIREAIYEAQRRGQSVVYHDYFLFSDALQIELHLNATQEAHQRYVADLEVLADSVRELAQTTDQ